MKTGKLGKEIKILDNARIGKQNKLQELKLKLENIKKQIYITESYIKYLENEISEIKNSEEFKIEAKSLGY